MKVVFFGTPHFVDPVIDVLKSNFDLVKIVNSPRQLNDEVIEEIKNLEPDFIIVAAFGKILSSEVLSIPKYGAVNIHPSLLPQYRGPTPAQTTILNGDKKTGVTVFKIDEKIDHGRIIVQEETEIKPNENSEELLARLFKLGAKLLEEALVSFANGEIKLCEQDETEATYTKIFTKNHGFIEINSVPEKEKLQRMILAFYPWPGVWTKYNLGGKETIIKLLPNDQIQVEGKKPMSYKDFRNGYENGSELLKRLGFEA